MTISRPDNLETFYLVLLLPGPAYDGWPTASPEQLRVMQAHVGFVMASQSGSGPMIAGGPVAPPSAEDAPRPVGVSILRADSLEDAEEFAGSDPGVVAGRFRVVVYPWMVPAGRLPSGPRETA